MTKRMRDLPAINKILEHPEIIDLIERYSLNNVTELVREIVGDVRRSMLEGEVESSIELIVSNTKTLAQQKWHYAPVAVVNATGVLIHTNLGRAALSE